jgi:putative DNA primase/helicase
MEIFQEMAKPFERSYFRWFDKGKEGRSPMELTVEVIKGFAIGRWPEIITALAPNLLPVVERGIKHGPCPLCGGKDRARRHNDFCDTGGIFCNQCGGGADGLAVLQWANPWTFREAKEAVASHLGLDNEIFSAPRQQLQTVHSKDWSSERRRLERTWDEAQPGAPRLCQYLEHRGLSVLLPNALRYHPGLDYYHEKNLVGTFPAMVAQIFRDGEMVGIHRTYLDINGLGKAPVEKPKKSMKCADTISGGAIQLHTPEKGKPLVLCEGIETGLAIYDYSGWPVWVCISSTLLPKVQLPDNAQDIYIAGDRDRSGAGEKAVLILGERLVIEGRKVRVAFPPIEIPDGVKSIDWLDYLTKEVICG